MMEMCISTADDSRHLMRDRQIRIVIDEVAFGVPGGGRGIHDSMSQRRRRRGES